MNDLKRTGRRTPVYTSHEQVLMGLTLAPVEILKQNEMIKLKPKFQYFILYMTGWKLKINNLG